MRAARHPAEANGHKVQPFSPFRADSMKKFLAAVVASIALMGVGCQSVESAKVDPATIASNGEAVAIVQCTALGFSALFHFVTITEASIDTVVNKMMVAE